MKGAHTYTLSDVYLCHGRSKPSMCSGSSSSGDPRSDRILTHYPPFKRRPHFAQCSLHCCLLVCFPDSGESQVTHVIFFLCTLNHCFTTPLLSISQVFCLLCIADCMVHFLWRQGKDPDSYSIPYLTALGDLLGTVLLSLAFVLLWYVGDSGIV